MESPNLEKCYFFRPGHPKESEGFWCIVRTCMFSIIQPKSQILTLTFFLLFCIFVNSRSLLCPPRQESHLTRLLIILARTCNAPYRMPGWKNRSVKLDSTVEMQVTAEITSSASKETFLNSLPALKHLRPTPLPLHYSRSPPANIPKLASSAAAAAAAAVAFRLRRHTRRRPPSPLPARLAIRRSW